MTTSVHDRPLLTLKEVARRLALSERTVRRLISAGVLPCARIGGVLRILPRYVSPGDDDLLGRVPASLEGTERYAVAENEGATVSSG
jgi:excisionase family DNA binding protein